VRERKRLSLPYWPALLCGLSLATVILGTLMLVGGPSALLAGTADGSADDIARQTVALALGIAPDSVRVISSIPRDFPDASLDCPQPDTAYAQVITPGFQALVEADGRRFDVRVAGSTGRICHPRKAPAPADKARIPSRQLALAARDDLASRLGLPPDAVTVTGLRRVKPGETLPGCDEVCGRDSVPADCAVAVRLLADDREFDYIAGQTGVRPCPDSASR
jgi:hypothetical protein